MISDDLLVVTRFRNLRLLNLLRAKRDTTGKPFYVMAQEIGVNEPTLYKFLSLGFCPYKIERGTGEILWNSPKQSAQRIASYFSLSVEEVFSSCLYAMRFPPKIEKSYASEEVMSLLEAHKQRLLPETTGRPMEEAGALADNIDKVLSSLPSKEQIVIRLRFGLDEKPCTLDEIARRLGRNRERIRQIEARALRRLRHPSRSESLRLFFESRNVR